MVASSLSLSRRVAPELELETTEAGLSVSCQTVGAVRVRVRDACRRTRAIELKERVYRRYGRGRPMCRPLAARVSTIDYI